MRTSNAVWATLCIILLLAAVTGKIRVAERDALLRARSDSADIRVSHLAAELEAASAVERRALDSVARLERHIRRLNGERATRTQRDSVVATVLPSDTLVPKSVVFKIMTYYEAQLATHNNVIEALTAENEEWHTLYASADKGRAALFDALQEERRLRVAWQRAAKPPLFSIRRLEGGVGCAAGWGVACGLTLSYKIF